MVHGRSDHTDIFDGVAVSADGLLADMARVFAPGEATAELIFGRLRRTIGLEISASKISVIQLKCLSLSSTLLQLQILPLNSKIAQHRNHSVYRPHAINSLLRCFCMSL